MAFAAFIPLIAAGLQALMGADEAPAQPVQRGKGVSPVAGPKDETGDMMNIGSAAMSAFGGGAGKAATGAGPQSSYGEAPKMEPLQLQSEGPQPAAAMDTAMNRRMEQIGTNPVQKLEQARMALSTQSPEIQREYAPILDKALRMAQYSRKGSLYGSGSPTTYS
jgi:hypothetical protein